MLKEDWWQIASNPDLGFWHTNAQQPVDFGVWKARDGNWQVWSCIRKTNEVGKTRVFYGWETADLYDEDWTPTGLKMRAMPQLGEEPGGMQAPFVLLHQDTFHLFYGDWNRICLGWSVDGKNFRRTALEQGMPALFGDTIETNTRDPMVLQTSTGQFICYYTAHPNQDGAIYARVSNDLFNWGPSQRVSYGGRVGKGKFWQAECPFVVEREGYYYLFRTANYGERNITHVYRSQDPLDFGLDNDNYYLTSLPVAAPEIFSVGEDWYIACLIPSLQGIRIGHLNWLDDP